MTLTDQPAVYVGTYAKYNSGSIAGQWLELEAYADRDAFYAACAELHKDEADPELMFQDWQSVPAGLVGESHIDAELWTWLALDDDDRQLLIAYCQATSNPSPSIEDAREHSQGTHDSERDFAQQLAEDIGAIPADATWPCSCIDWEQATRELMMDYTAIRHNGTLYIFRD